jgi:hypothetical protein
MVNIPKSPERAAQYLHEGLPWIGWRWMSGEGSVLDTEASQGPLLDWLALTGLDLFGALIPMALPWASVVQAFGLHPPSGFSTTPVSLFCPAPVGNTADFCTRLLSLWISVETLSPNHPNTLKSHRERRRYAKSMECGGPTPLSTRRPDDASRPRPTPPPKRPQPPSPQPPSASLCVQPPRGKAHRGSAERRGVRQRAKSVAAGPATAGQAPPRKAGAGPRTPRLSPSCHTAQSILRRGKISRASATGARESSGDTARFWFKMLRPC